MVTTAQNQQKFMVLTIIALFLYLGTVLQTWDLTHFRNLNTTIIALYALSALSAVYLFFTQKLPAPNPAILCYTAIGILATLMLPFLEYPVGSIIGIPVSGMGILQVFAGAIIAYITYIACLHNTKNQSFIIIGAIIAMTAFIVIGKLDVAGFALWDDVYALIAMPSIVIMTAGIYNPCKKTKIISMVGICIAIYAIFISANNVSKALVVIAPILMGGLFIIDKIFKEKSNLIKPLLIPAAIIVATLVIFSSILFLDVLYALKNEKSQFGSILKTITQRCLILLNYVVAGQQEPFAFLTGFGFASPTYIQHLYAPLTHATYTPNESIFVASDTRNIGTGGMGATSLHSFLFDIMAGVGIIGGILFLTMLYFIGKSASKYNTLMTAWIALAVLYSFWFPTAVTIVPFFVAIGITCALKYNNQNTNDSIECNALNKKNIKPIVFFAPAIVLLLGSVYYIKQIQLMNKTIINQKVSPELFYKDTYNQDHTNYTMSLSFFRLRAAGALNKLINGETITETELLMFVDTMDVYAQKSDDNHPLMIVEFLHIINIVMGQGEEKDMLKARQRYFPLWVPTIKKAVANAPYRFDLWKPYFDFLRKYKKYNEMGNMAQYILENGNPNDPTALFYRGMAFSALGDEKSAQKDIQRAVDNGIAFIIFNAKDFLKN